MIRMSMNELSTYSWTFDQDVFRYLAAGYEGIGVWRPKLTDYGEQKGMELLRESGLAVSNLLWAGGFTGSDGLGYRESIEDAAEAIRLAQELQTDCLVVYSGSRAGHTHNHARRMTRQALAELLPVAQNAGVTLALEPVHEDTGGEWSFLNDLQGAVDFLDSLSSTSFKLVFDTYHLGLAPVDLRLVESIASRIAIVHLADARQPPNGEPNRCLLGQGSVPLADIAAALLEGGFTGYWDVELMGEDVEGISYDHILQQSRQAMTQLLQDSTQARS